MLEYSWQTGDSMGFLMDGLEAEAYDRKYTDRALLARIIGYFRPRRGLMVFVALLVVLNPLVDTPFPLLFSLLVGLLFFRNVYLALLTLTIVPAIVLVALVFRRIARRTTRRAQRSLARANANVQEVVSGITVAKNFRQEQNMYNEFVRVNEQSYQVNLRSGFVYSGVFPFLFFIANLGTTIVVYFGGRSVLAPTVLAGDYVLLVA